MGGSVSGVIRTSAAPATKWTEWTKGHQWTEWTERLVVDLAATPLASYHLSFLFRYWNRSFTSLLAPLKVLAASAPFK